MKRFFSFCLFAVLIFSLQACSNSNVEKLNGEWKCDGDATLKLQKKETADANPSASNIEKTLVNSMFGSIKVSFDTKANKMTFSMGKVSKNSDFKVISDSGDTIILEETNEKEKAHIKFTGDDTIILSKDAEDKQGIVLVRVK